MYPWSRPYVPHAARPLQPHPLSACLPACWHTYERRLRHRRRTYVVSRARPCGRATLSPCARVYVHRRARNSIEMRPAAARNFRNSASARARPLSTLVNRGSSHQPRRRSPAPSSPSLSRGQDLPLKPSHSSTGKKRPKCKGCERAGDRWSNERPRFLASVFSFSFFTNRSIKLREERARMRKHRFTMTSARRGVFDSPRAETAA